MPLPVLNYVDRVGVELEGGWNRRFPDCRLTYDVSVGRPPNASGRACCCKQGHGNDMTCHFGELPSPALPLEELLFWMKEHYPDGTNATCGFHVHVSVKNPMLYAQLMDKRFYDLFLKKVRTWGKEEKFPDDHQLWHRLTSKDYKNSPAKHCNRPFNAVAQSTLLDKPEIRRSAINYPFLKHGTLEARIFPAFPDVAVAARAVILFVGTIEDWLRSCPPPQKEVIKLIKNVEEISKIAATFSPLRG